MTQKPKFSLEQFNAKHVIPTKAQQQLIGGTLKFEGGFGSQKPFRVIFEDDTDK